MKKKLSLKQFKLSQFGKSQKLLTNKGMKYLDAAVEVLPEILLICSYPPRECGIATYSHDLMLAVNNKFDRSFKLTVCALESDHEQHEYPEEVSYVLNTDKAKSFHKIAREINRNENIKQVLIQHEFGFFENKASDFELFLYAITKPILLVFHTVLPKPNKVLQSVVQSIAEVSESIMVMTHFSKNLLVNDYGIPLKKITVIPHGTHLVPHEDKQVLKEKHHLSGKKILATFGLLSQGKSIETTLDALPKIVKQHPDVLFLIIGKTHPTILKNEGEKYRKLLQDKVAELKLEQHVKFINAFLPLCELLEYLQLTDVYLFTSKDPHQAVSGTFSYAISCGCPIVSTPIPHALEVLKKDTGIIVDFEQPEQVSEAVNSLLGNDNLRKEISFNGLHLMASTAWENTAIAHCKLFQKIRPDSFSLTYTLPEINLDHLIKMTDHFGIIQFSKINQPDIDSGYTLDDNARALIAMSQYFVSTKDESILKYIAIYFRFIEFCFQKNSYFLNYVNEEQQFTEQNNAANLADSNGRAIWALGYVCMINHHFPSSHQYIGEQASMMLQDSIGNVNKIHSTRAMAFIIKGYYYRNVQQESEQNIDLIKKLANRLVQMYKHEASIEWQWFESYLTYANSIIPEALLCAYLATEDLNYKNLAKISFDFLLSKIFLQNRIKIISNKGWMLKDKEISETEGGEQPIDVAYTILALSKFSEVFPESGYQETMKCCFDWFLGSNYLHQIIYNPCTGGCYDGLEEHNVNLNQGAESTVSYLMARLTVDPILLKQQQEKFKKKTALKRKPELEEVL